MTARRVVVLGGTGFLGSAVARAFVLRGWAVTAVSRNPPGPDASPFLAGATLVTGDAEDPTLLASLLDDADHIVHAVGSVLPEESNRNPVDSIMLTLPGLLALLETLRVRPTVGFTYLSSGGTVYGNQPSFPINESAECEPISSYGVVKLAAEKYAGMYAQLYGIPVRVLRVANAYGCIQPTDGGQGVVAAFLAAAISGAPVHLYGDGSNVRDYVHVDDVADAVVQLASMEDGARVLNVGTETGHTVREVLRLVEEVTECRLRATWHSAREHDVDSIVLDVGRLRAAVDWQPLPLAQGIVEVWDDLRSQRTRAGVERLS